jgi:hypothetical protein
MYLRCFTSSAPKQWVKWLPWVEFCYNTGFHSATKRTPFEIVYGRSPPSLLSYIPGTTCLAAVEEALVARDNILREVRHQLLGAQNRMKQIYDKSHTKREFFPREWVYLRLHGYRHTLWLEGLIKNYLRSFMVPIVLFPKLDRSPIAWLSLLRPRFMMFSMFLSLRNGWVRVVQFKITYLQLMWRMSCPCLKLFCSLELIKSTRRYLFTGKDVPLQMPLGNPFLILSFDIHLLP